MEVSELLANATEASLKRGEFPIVLGGDHSQAIGSLTGLKQASPDAKVIWIDAHLDAHLPITSPSGNVHGMPVGILSGDGDGSKVLDLSTDILYLGTRSYEPAEEKLVKKYGIPIFPVSECDNDKLPLITAKIGKHFGWTKKRADPYWISFDIDGVDEREFMSTGTPEEQGLTMSFVTDFMKKFVPGALGMDFTEVNFKRTSDK